MKCNYTIPVSDIIYQIWDDDHENESIEPLSDWRNFLTDVDTKVEYAAPFIFGENWECWGSDEDRLGLEKHILNDYFTRNINCDSVARWVLFLRNRMKDIMPKYVALYNAQVEILATSVLDPTHIEETKDIQANKSSDNATHSSNVGTTENHSESNSSNVSSNKGTDTTNTKDVNKFSNTPQALSDAVDSGDEIPLNYLSTMATDNTNTINDYDSKTDSNDTSTSKQQTKDNTEYSANESENETRIEQYVKRIKGNMSRYNNGQLLKDYQDAIMNIESMISEELRDLFFLIY